jgi:hypothetical protein
MRKINAKKMSIEGSEGRLLGGPDNKWEEDGPVTMDLLKRS